VIVDDLDTFDAQQLRDALSPPPVAATATPARPRRLSHRAGHRLQPQALGGADALPRWRRPTHQLQLGGEPQPESPRQLRRPVGL